MRLLSAAGHRYGLRLVEDRKGAKKRLSQQEMAEIVNRLSVGELAARQKRPTEDECSRLVCKFSENRALSLRDSNVLFYRAGLSQVIHKEEIMGAAFFAVSAPYPEVLGEMPFFSDQSAMSHEAARSHPGLRSEEEEVALLVRQNDQILWATLGKWDL